MLLILTSVVLKNLVEMTVTFSSLLKNISDFSFESEKPFRHQEIIKNH